MPLPALLAAMPAVLGAMGKTAAVTAGTQMAKNAMTPRGGSQGGSSIDPLLLTAPGLYLLKQMFNPQTSDDSGDEQGGNWGNRRDFGYGHRDRQTNAQGYMQSPMGPQFQGNQMQPPMMNGGAFGGQQQNMLARRRVPPGFGGQGSFYDQQQY